MSLEPRLEAIRGHIPFERWGMRIGLGIGVVAGVVAEVVLPKYFYDQRVDTCSPSTTHKDCVDLAQNDAVASGLLIFAGAVMTVLLLAGIGKKIGSLCGTAHYNAQGRNVRYIPPEQMMSSLSLNDGAFDFPAQA